MPAQRRRSDSRVSVIHVQADWDHQPQRIRLRRVDAGDGSDVGQAAFVVEELNPTEVPDEALVVVELGDGTALEMVATAVRTLSVTGARERYEGAFAGAALHAERRQRELDRLRRAATWMLLVEQLSRSSTREELLMTFAERVAEMMNAHSALVYTRGVGAAADSLQPMGTGSVEAPLRPLPLSLLEAALPLQLLRSECKSARTGLLAALWPVFVELDAASLALSALGEDALLLVAERRQDRLFTGDDWFILRNITGQAAMALDRLEYRRLLAPMAGKVQ